MIDGELSDSDSYPLLSDSSEEYDPYSEPIISPVDDIIICNDKLNEFTYELQLKEALRLSLKTPGPKENLGLIYQLDSIMGALFLHGFISIGSLKIFEAFASTRKFYYDLFRRNYQYIMDNMIKLRIVPDFELLENIFDQNYFFGPMKFKVELIGGIKYYKVEFGEVTYRTQRLISVARCTENLCIIPRTITYMYMLCADEDDKKYNFFFYLENGRLHGGYRHDEEVKEFLLGNY
jgi:hypothetical protein